MTTLTQVRERPIIFDAESVRRILDGRQTQTRRVVKPQPHHGIRSFWNLSGDFKPGWDAESTRDLPGDVLRAANECIRCPYGEPGDRLWVRETWQYADWTEDGEPWTRYRADGETRLHTADTVPDDWWESRLPDIWAGLSDPANYAIDRKAADRRWRSPRLMPRWASRLTLEITDVRVERVQEITEADALAEGVVLHPSDAGLRKAPRAFRGLWNSLNAARGFGWDANPWVWVISFRRVDGAA